MARGPVRCKHDTRVNTSQVIIEPKLARTTIYRESNVYSISYRLLKNSNQIVTSKGVISKDQREAKVRDGEAEKVD